MLHNIPNVTGQQQPTIIAKKQNHYHHQQQTILHFMICHSNKCHISAICHSNKCQTIMSVTHTEKD